MKIIVFRFKFYRMVFLKFSNKSAFVRVIPWCQSGKTPLPEPILSKNFCTKWTAIMYDFNIEIYPLIIPLTTVIVSVEYSSFVVCLFVYFFVCLFVCLRGWGWGWGAIISRKVTGSNGEGMLFIIFTNTLQPAGCCYAYGGPRRTINHGDFAALTLTKCDQSWL